MSARTEARVLVIDPDASIRALLAACLKRKGIAADGVGDSDGALQRAATEHYEAFIVEPRIAGGDVLLAQLHDRCGCRSNIIIATSPDATSPALLSHPGVAAVLVKPFLLDDLYAIIDAWSHG